MILLDGSVPEEKGDGHDGQPAVVDNGRWGRPPTTLLVLLLSVAGWCLIAGCNDSRRASLEGTVSFDGQPVPSGWIRFLPLEDTKSPTAGGEIVDGEFSIPAQKGPFQGTFRVEITARRGTGKKIPHPASGEMLEMHEQYLPARYNTASDLKVDVQTGQSNRFAFNLQSP